MKGLSKKLLATVIASIALSATAADKAPKVLVLGVDGLDPKLLQAFVDAGELPNFERLIREGDFKSLGTSMPPLSPIAWSTFITGMDPGGHGIYDFIHRDPKTMLPYLAMSRTVGEEVKFSVGAWTFLLKGTQPENLRRGTSFWEILDEHDVPTTIFRMPANYPPVDSKGHSLSGMGTPDFRGTPGTFSYYTERPVPNEKDFSGGDVYRVKPEDGVIRAELYGPKNPFRRVKKKRGVGRGDKVEYENPDLAVPFAVYVDPERPVAKFVVQDNEFVLEEGEWSPWVPVSFDAALLAPSLSATARFYLQQVSPEFKLYVTPLQINPDDPAMQISDPDDWSHELCEELGFFYTQELPEDTKALTNGIFTGLEFWEQANFVYEERRRALDYFLDRFDEGLLFFYFSSVDQQSHMLWNYMDSEHPGHIDDAKLGQGISHIYRELDEAVGRVMETIDDDTTLMIMSDHGFSPFYWGVNLNTWLLEKGYVKLKNPAAQGRTELFLNVDWSRTRAYALGLNGLYLNLRGRERNGIVDAAEYQSLLDQLEKELLEMKDPRNGESPVTLVIQSRRDFHGEYADDGPDIVVGYNWGYRSSWSSPLGKFPKQVFVDNDEAWSGDHSIDYRLVPGTLISNRKITLDSPALYDLTVTILDEYGIPKPEQMIGQDCLGPPSTASRQESPAEERPRSGS